MMKRFLPLFFLLFVSFAFTVTPKESRFYRSDWRLRTDTNYRIGPLRLKKWMKVEDTICRLSCRYLHYPDMLREMEVMGNFILSFDLDDSGRVSGFVMEGDTTSPAYKYNLLFFLESRRVIQGIASCFPARGFKAEKGKTEKYYLPFRFMLDKDKVECGERNGYIRLVVAPPVPVREDEQRSTLIH